MKIINRCIKINEESFIVSMINPKVNKTLDSIKFGEIR